MRLYFVVAIYGLLLRAVASMRKFTARFLAPAACAVLSDRPCSWFINGALSTAGLCIFSAQSLGIPPCLCLFLAAHPFVMIDNFRLICFLSSPLALDLSPAPYRLSSRKQKPGIKRGFRIYGVYLMPKLCAAFKFINFRTRFCGRKFNTALIATCKNAPAGFILSSNLSPKIPHGIAESNLICDRLALIDACKIRLNLRG